MPMTTTYTESYSDIIFENLTNCLTTTDLAEGKKLQGKVRDIYDLGDAFALITTDRQSAFDRVLASVPFKGQVLNLTSAWWFEKTKHIIDNHVLSIPHPNVTLAKKCEVFPVEFVVRGYLTGTTSTSILTQYNNGVRNYCGNQLPEGLKKNQRFAKPLLTPTTKDIDHDEPVSLDEIIELGLMTKEDLEYVADKAMQLFEFGVKTAKQHGLILVDTKYEFGKDADGNILLIDEIHTPDSSRYWLLDGYEDAFNNNENPKNIDKEFLRLWFKGKCDPYNDKELPKVPDELIATLSSRYIQLFEMITGDTFNFDFTPIQDVLSKLNKL